MSILDSGKNFLLDKSGLQQHFDENEVLRAAANEGIISNELYNKMGGFNFKENVPFAGDFGTGLGSFTYNVAQSVLGNQPISEIPGDVARNYMGAAAGLTKDEKDLYDSILGQRESPLTDSLANIPSNIKNTLGDLIFTPTSADADKPPPNTGARDFSEFDKARMGAELAAQGINPELISQIDARTADEEGALLDDAFENQLAIATRTGKLGPLEGIFNALNPKNALKLATGFVTDTVPLGLASFADKLGIRRGMSEPPGAVGTGGYGVSRQGNTLTNQTRRNRSEFDNFYSQFQGGAQHHMGKRVDDVISRIGSGKRTRSDASDFVNKYGSEEQKTNFAKTKEQARRDNLTSQFKSEEGDTGGSSKIVCTMMNKSYGFGSFRNKIWMKFHKDLSPEYQKGYHKIFLPLVKIAKKNKIVKKILEHIAVHSTIDMRQSMRGKKHLLGRLYRKIILPICYWVGKK